MVILIKCSLQWNFYFDTKLSIVCSIKIYAYCQYNLYCNSNELLPSLSSTFITLTVVNINKIIILITKSINILITIKAFYF